MDPPLIEHVNVLLDISSLAIIEGAQWLSGRVLDLRPKGRGFEPHRRHCIVVLEQDTFILTLVLVQHRKTRLYITERLLMGHKESNQTKKLAIIGSIISYVMILPC